MNPPTRRRRRKAPTMPCPTLPPPDRAAPSPGRTSNRRTTGAERSPGAAMDAGREVASGAASTAQLKPSRPRQRRLRFLSVATAPSPTSSSAPPPATTQPTPLPPPLTVAAAAGSPVRQEEGRCAPMDAAGPVGHLRDPGQTSTGLPSNRRLAHLLTTAFAAGSLNSRSLRPLPSPALHRTAHLLPFDRATVAAAAEVLDSGLLHKQASIIVNYCFYSNACMPEESISLMEREESIGVTALHQILISAPWKTYCMKGRSHRNTGLAKWKKWEQLTRPKLNLIMSATRGTVANNLFE